MRNFWLFFIVFVPISCFKLVILRKTVMIYILLNVSLKPMWMLNMCQCLFIISFIFGNAVLYVTESGIESLHFGSQYFKSNDLSRCSTLSICFLKFDSSQPFSTNLFRRSWKCFMDYPKVGHMRLILSIWL